LETSLVARARAGDADAFEELVRDRADRVVRLAMAIVADETEARDVAQEAFIAAWRQLKELRDAERFDEWLTRIVVNQARMALRARRRRRIREIPAPEVASLAGDGHLAPPDRSAAPLQGDAGRLVEALDRLDPDRRAILAMHHLEGRSVAEIAATLEIPIGTVKSRLFTARQALERALTAKRDDGSGLTR
jgi:RNA polymerase sigma-70 factor (ECF subfamily)